MERQIAPVKGMADFYPADYALLEWLSSRWIELGNRYGYAVYEGPLLEPIELYLGKSSEQIVNEQTFSLIDRSGKTLHDHGQRPGPATASGRTWPDVRIVIPES